MDKKIFNKKSGEIKSYSIPTLKVLHLSMRYNYLNQASGTTGGGDLPGGFIEEGDD